MKGHEFKQMRQTLGMSVNDVANVMGPRARTIRRWEKDSQRHVPDFASKWISGMAAGNPAPLQTGEK